MSAVRITAGKRFLTSVTTSTSTAAPVSAKPFSEIPGPLPVPNYGTYPTFMERVQRTDILRAANSYYHDFGRIVKQEFMGPEVWCYDPEEVLKAFRQEGSYPTNSASEGWPTRKYYSERKMFKAPFLSVGPVWQEGRRKLQRDIFPPAVAESYLPLLDPPVRLASDAVLGAEESFSQFAPCVTLDMFLSVVLGYNPATVSKFINGKADSPDHQFARDAQNAMHRTVDLMLNPQNPDERYKLLEKDMDGVVSRSRELIQDFIKDLNAQKFRSPESPPYVERLIKRNEMSQDEMTETLMTLLQAGVETTSGVILWLILHLAQNPDKQERLRNELLSVMGEKSRLEAAHLKKLPYLSLCMHESFRLAPFSMFITYRRFDRDIELCGYHIPKGVKVNFMSSAVQLDPRVVDEVDAFIPERWSPEAVAARKGTPKEILDHKAIAKQAFGYGPRMCIGARLAELEIKAFTARLVRDWKFVTNPKEQAYKVMMGTGLRPEPFPKLAFAKVR